MQTHGLASRLQRIARRARLAASVFGAIATVSVISCSSSPDANVPASDSEPTGGARSAAALNDTPVGRPVDSTPPGPEAANEPAPPASPTPTPPIADAPAPAPVTTTPPPAASSPPTPITSSTAPRTRDFDALRFTVSTIANWIEVPGSYRDDFGSLLSLIPEGDATGRAIDVYRDAVLVPAALTDPAISAHWTTLTTTHPDLLWTKGSDETIEGRQFQVRTVTNPAAAERIQEHRVFVCEDGIYSIVLSTRPNTVESDRAVVRELLKSFKFKDLTAVRNAVRATLPYNCGRPEGWMLAVSGKRAVFRAPLRADSMGALRRNQLSITVTTVSKALLAQETRQEYVRQLALAMVPDSASPQDRNAAAPSASWGDHLGLATATLIPVVDPQAAETPAYRKTIVIFGRTNTFVLSLHADDEDKVVAEAQLAVFLSRFSETK